MELQSMTGFSRCNGQFSDTGWTWEIRSVNGKSLDLRFRTPPGFEATENAARKLAQNRLDRGNLQISLQLHQTSSTRLPVLNQDAVDAIITLATGLKEKIGGQMPTISDLLMMRGVLEMSDASTDKESRAAYENALQVSFSQALDELIKARQGEGNALTPIISNITSRLAQFVSDIRQDASRTPQAIAQRLNEKIQHLLSDNTKLDAQRLHQEIALLAVKADIQEELDRLDVHLSSMRELLDGGGPIGRRMEFLCQEINRECNTICSKSDRISITTTGLDMKLLIDQLREQIQNLE